MVPLALAAACGPTGRATIADGPVPDATTATAAPATTPTTGATTSTTVTVRTPATVEVFALPEDEGGELTDDQWWQSQPGHLDARAALLACIRSYEQGADGYATDTGNGYYGAYQFTLATWSAVGGTGNPAHASPAEQDDRAWALYLARGLAPWPTPSRRCG